jgi:hypothetical protein
MNRLIREAIDYIKSMRERGYSDEYIDAAYLSKQCRLSAYEFNQLLNERA